METKRCPGCMKEINQPVCPHCGWSAYDQNAPHQLPVGTVLNDKYIVGRALGQGGFGITYLGWDKYLEQRVAIKEYYPSGSVMRESEVSTVVASYGGALATRYQRNKERFLREAQILARFNEEKEIVHVSSMFEANNTAYFVMEFVDGITLKQHVKNSGGKLGIKETFALLKPVIHALEKVHQAGLVHRDISPDNIMLLPGGGVKLIDFGAVRNVGNADQEMPQTKSTEAILKQGYAPIEQYQNRGSLGPWTDVYALCATILFCLTGEVPPDAPERLLTEAPLEIQKRIPALSAHQAAVLEQGMAMHPRDRIPSMSELQKQLFSPIAKILPPPAPAKTDEPAPKPKKRKWWIPVVAIVIVVGILFALFPVIQRHREQAALEAERLAQEAELERQRLLIESIYENNVMQGINPDKECYAYNNEGYILYTLNVPNSDILKEEIASITILDTLENAPEDAWDISEKQNGNVLAWVEAADSSISDLAIYDLYIAGNGGVAAPEESCNLFAGYINAHTIDFGDAFYTRRAVDMDYMFCDNHKVECLDLSCFDTSGATMMMGMFQSCYALTEIDVSSFDTSHVTTMEDMFALGKHYISAMKSLDLSHFDTSACMDFGRMFESCTSLELLDISSFQISPGATTTDMFVNLPESCVILKTPEEKEAYYAPPTEPPAPVITGIPAEDNVLMPNLLDGEILDINPEEAVGSAVFGNDRIRREAVVTLIFHDTLADAPEDAWDVSQKQLGCVLAWAEQEGSYYNLHIGAEGGVYAPEDSSLLFAFYRKLEEISFNGAFHTENVTNMSGMFFNLEALETLDFNGFDTSNVTDLSYLLAGCYSLKALDISALDTSNATNMAYTFAIGYHSYCYEYTYDDGTVDSGVSHGYVGTDKRVPLSSLDISTLNTFQVTDMSGLFYGLSGLTELDVSTLDTSHVTDMSDMFSYCFGLTELDVSTLDTANVTSMNGMFEYCSNLTELDLRSFDTSNVTDMGYMFGDCTSLKKLDISSFDTGLATFMGGMFYYCKSLTRLDVSHFDTANVTYMGHMFNGCESLTSLDVTNFDTSNVTDMGFMFSECQKLQSLDLRNFNTSKVTSMYGMFYTFDGTVVQDDGSLATNSGSLRSLDLSSFDTSNVQDMSWMFRGQNYLNYLNLSSFDTHNVTNMDMMFYGVGASLIPIIDPEKFDTSNVDTSGEYFFSWFYDTRYSYEPWDWYYLFEEQYDAYLNAMWEDEYEAYLEWLEDESNNSTDPS